MSRYAHARHLLALGGGVYLLSLTCMAQGKELTTVEAIKLCPKVFDERKKPSPAAPCSAWIRPLLYDYCGGVGSARSCGKPSGIQSCCASVVATFFAGLRSPYRVAAC